MVLEVLLPPTLSLWDRQDFIYILLFDWSHPRFSESYYNHLSKQACSGPSGRVAARSALKIMPPSLAASIPKMVGNMTSGNGCPPHTPLSIASSHCQMRRHHPQGNTSWADTWPLWGHPPQQTSFTYSGITSMREKNEDSGDQVAEVTTEFALTFLAFPCLLDRSFRYVQWPLGTCQPGCPPSPCCLSTSHYSNSFSKLLH